MLFQKVDEFKTTITVLHMKLCKVAIFNLFSAMWLLSEIFKLLVLLNIKLINCSATVSGKNVIER